MTGPMWISMAWAVTASREREHGNCQSAWTLRSQAFPNQNGSQKARKSDRIATRGEVMKNRASVRTILSLMLTIVVAIFANAQRSTPSQDQQKSQPPSGVPPMSMNEMMQGCSKHSEISTTILESVIRQAEAAKQSRELPKMQLALDNAQQQLQEVKKHVESCRSMIDMMRKMNSGGRGRQDEKTPAPKK